MPSSEVTAGHNPSRISIDNGTYMYKTQKKSHIYIYIFVGVLEISVNYRYIYHRVHMHRVCLKLHAMLAAGAGMHACARGQVSVRSSKKKGGTRGKRKGTGYTTSYLCRTYPPQD